MQKEFLKKLYEPFQLKERKGLGGMIFKYIPNEDVIHRMNEVFGEKWSTIVTFRDIIEDQVVLEVQVKLSIEDKHSDNNQEYTAFSSSIQTGFGSHLIMRYKDGPNINKIIDIGNSYKSALSKAIVNACSKWGVGLFKESEENLYDIEDHEPEIKIPILVSNSENIIKLPTQKQESFSNTTSKKIESNVIINQVHVSNDTSSILVPNLGKSKEINSKNTKPAIIINNEPETKELPFSSQNTQMNDLISNVQKVALNGILSINNVSYEVLAKEAFEKKGMNIAIPSVDKLKYDEAVVIIKYGNNKYRNR